MSNSNITFSVNHSIALPLVLRSKTNPFFYFQQHFPHLYTRVFIIIFNQYASMHIQYVSQLHNKLKMD